MQTFEIIKDGKPVKALKAKGMESIYAQYKKYCATKHATLFIECSQDESFGLGYWANYTDNFYLRKVEA